MKEYMKMKHTKKWSPYIGCMGYFDTKAIFHILSSTVVISMSKSPLQRDYRIIGEAKDMILVTSDGFFVSGVKKKLVKIDK